MTDPTPDRVQLNLVSEVAFAEGAPPRPIHMLRVGTFTANSGRQVTFSTDDLRAIAANFTAGGRKRPPITERHDYGRAVGRITKVWTDGENLYGQPTWNKVGRELLADEVYDGFSAEIDMAGMVLFGGTLTNYPAVSELAAVTLEAPPADDGGPWTTIEVIPWDDMPEHLGATRAPSPGARVDTSNTTEDDDMAEEVTTSQPPVDTQQAAPPLPPVNDAAMSAQISAYVQQMEARYQAQQEAAFTRAQQEFERRIADMEARRQVEAYAQNLTTATLTRPYALPGQADDYSAVLLSLSAPQRASVQALFDKILAGGLVNFEEIGTGGEGEEAQDARAQYEAAVAAEMAKNGGSKTQALLAVNRAHPELYAAQATKKGGR